MVGRTTAEVDAIIGAVDDWRGGVLSRLREIVLSADPAISEDVKCNKPSRQEGVPVWSADANVWLGEMLRTRCG
jgi:hypothetical protein